MLNDFLLLFIFYDKQKLKQKVIYQRKRKEKNLSILNVLENV